MATQEPDLRPAAAYDTPFIDAKAEPTLKNPEAEAFYAEASTYSLVAPPLGTGAVRQ